MSTRVVYRVSYPAKDPTTAVRCTHYDYLKPEHGTRKVTLTTKVKPKGRDWNWALIQLAKGRRVRRASSIVGAWIVLLDGTPCWYNGVKLDHDDLSDCADDTDWVLA